MKVMKICQQKYEALVIKLFCHALTNLFYFKHSNGMSCEEESFAIMFMLRS